MRLKIKHLTEYSYTAPVPYALQRLRLFPMSGATQAVKAWTLDIEGAREEVRFADHFGNDTRLVSMEGESRIAITVSGEVETSDTHGMSGPHRGFAPLWLFLPQTPLTTGGPRTVELAEAVGEGSDLDRLHRMMGMIAEKIVYETGTTNPATTAEDALVQGRGVCQDHTHVFLSAARHLGFPARYVSGYLRMEGVDEQVASHAWAEAHVDAVGWVGFDSSNGISPDERYVRLATGRDYREAMPISGIRLGAAEERLAVRITVEQ